MLLSSSIRLLANRTIKTAIIYSQTRTGVWQSDHIDPIVNKEKLYVNTVKLLAVAYSKRRNLFK